MLALSGSERERSIAHHITSHHITSHPYASPSSPSHFSSSLRVTVSASSWQRTTVRRSLSLSISHARLLTAPPFLRSVTPSHTDWPASIALPQGRQSQRFVRPARAMRSYYCVVSVAVLLCLWCVSLTTACTVGQDNRRVVGDVSTEYAPTDARSWIARLYVTNTTKKSGYCSGSLVRGILSETQADTKITILTAAHCLYGIAFPGGPPNPMVSVTVSMNGVTTYAQDFYAPPGETAACVTTWSTNWQAIADAATTQPDAIAMYDYGIIVCTPGNMTNSAAWSRFLDVGFGIKGNTPNLAQTAAYSYGYSIVGFQPNQLLMVGNEAQPQVMINADADLLLEVTPLSLQGGQSGSPLYQIETDANGVNRFLVGILSGDNSGLRPTPACINYANRLRPTVMADLSHVYQLAISAQNKAAEFAIGDTNPGQPPYPFFQVTTGPVALSTANELQPVTAINELWGFALMHSPSSNLNQNSVFRYTTKALYNQAYLGSRSYLTNTPFMQLNPAGGTACGPVTPNGCGTLLAEQLAPGVKNYDPLVEFIYPPIANPQATDLTIASYPTGAVIRLCGNQDFNLQTLAGAAPGPCERLLTDGFIPANWV